MARLPRLAIAGHLHHLLLRGHNGQPAFADEDDFRFFLATTAASCATHGVECHAYVLLERAVHLLMTPRDAAALPTAMQALGRRYVRYFNDRHRRAGTLWEGRYRSSVLQPEPYALACMAWFDTLPVQQGLVDEPGHYPWSSHGHYVGLRHDRWLVPPAQVWALGNTPFAREAAYASRVARGVSLSEHAAFADLAPAGWVLGDSAFVHSLQEHTGRRLIKAASGRPRKPRPR